MTANGTLRSAPRAARPGTPAASVHVPSLRVLPEGKAVLLQESPGGSGRQRNARGQFTSSANTLPGSSELQTILASDDLNEPPSQNDIDYIGPTAPDNIQVEYRYITVPAPLPSAPYAPIHNRFYVVWITASIIGMALVGLTVHYFGL